MATDAVTATGTARETGVVHVTVRDGIGEVVLDAPPLNILTRAILGQLRHALEGLIRESVLRVVLLRSEGKHFSAGASVEEHLPGTVETMIPEFMETIQALHHFPLPVVCAVQGRCLGGALELAMAADIVIATDSALFGVPEISLGVMPPAACVQLPMRTRPGVAAALLFTGAPMSASAAHDAGLVHRVVAVDELLPESAGLAESIAVHSAPALRATKRALRSGSSTFDASMTEASRIYLEELMKTRDAVEGLQSFMEKREPQWRHE
jgi:cyclohexa-1,5-dienecarbonyl-CoA hydratase